MSYFVSDPWGIISHLGLLGFLLFLMLGGALFVLALLVPWFIWRTKVYTKLCYIELQKMNETRSKVAVVEESPK